MRICGNAQSTHLLRRFRIVLPKFIRFLAAGGIGVALYYGTFLFLKDGLGLWYLAAAAAGSVLNFSSNFLMQKFWTFKNQDAGNVMRLQAKKYLALSITLAASNIGLMYLLVDVARFAELASQVIVTAILTITSYVITKIIFAKKSKEAPI